MADVWDFPCVLAVALYVFLAFLQVSLNHGARCLAHLFGFLWLRGWISVTTPAFVASASINNSIAAARASLSFSNWAAVSLNVLENSAVDVCDFHLAALVLYSFRYSPGIQRYEFSFSLCVFLLAGGEAGVMQSCWETLSWWCGWRRVVVGLLAVSGRWVNRRSWSV
jgi:hypothetical protein